MYPTVHGIGSQLLSISLTALKSDTSMTKPQCDPSAPQLPQVAQVAPVASTRKRSSTVKLAKKLYPKKSTSHQHFSHISL